MEQINRKQFLMVRLLFHLVRRRQWVKIEFSQFVLFPMVSINMSRHGRFVVKHSVAIVARIFDVQVFALNVDHMVGNISIADLANLSPRFRFYLDHFFKLF